MPSAVLYELAAMTGLVVGLVEHGKATEHPAPLRYLLRTLIGLSALLAVNALDPPGAGDPPPCVRSHHCTRLPQLADS